jgi:hypothetical protein
MSTNLQLVREYVHLTQSKAIREDEYVKWLEQELLKERAMYGNCEMIAIVCAEDRCNCNGDTAKCRLKNK